MIGKILICNFQTYLKTNESLKIRHLPQRSYQKLHQRTPKYQQRVKNLQLRA